MKKIMNLLAVYMLLLATSCKKYLEEKPDKKLAVPVTIKDAQALLDNFGSMNCTYASSASASDDDFYLTDAYYNSLNLDYRILYTWDKLSVNARTNTEWNSLYADVLNANLALETVNKITPTITNEAAWKTAKGGALFYRAFIFLNLVQQYAQPYNKATAGMLPGIPLKLSADVNEPVTRAPLSDCYQRILTDLQAAAELLPNLDFHVARPSKAAAYGVMARTSLQMQEYALAEKYADSCLAINARLVDYNTVNASLALPFSMFNNAEVIFYSTVTGYPMVNVTNGRVDSVLYKSYAANDLRKAVFFKTNGTGANTYYSFKGHYSESSFGECFTGIATDEQYLIKAECRARAGDVAGALQWLNSLLVKRWKAGSFIPFTAADAGSALQLVLNERRKELLFRSIRWYDLRRLNQEATFAVTLKRKIGGVEYRLPPNDKRYTFFIPQVVIDKSGIAQNER